MFILIVLSILIIHILIHPTCRTILVLLICIFVKYIKLRSFLENSPVLIPFFTFYNIIFIKKKNLNC
jgi:hypothetical protein